MQNRFQKLTGFLRRRRALLVSSGVMAVMLTLTGLALQVSPNASERQLVCSLKSGAHRGKALSRSLLDSRCTASRVDRIVSGALQFASSL